MDTNCVMGSRGKWDPLDDDSDYKYCMMMKGENGLMMRALGNASGQTKKFAREIIEKTAAVLGNCKHEKGV
jgi:hypothetical protein